MTVDFADRRAARIAATIEPYDDLATFHDFQPASATVAKEDVSRYLDSIRARAEALCYADIDATKSGWEDTFNLVAVKVEEVTYRDLQGVMDLDDAADAVPA